MTARLPAARGTTPVARRLRGALGGQDSKAGEARYQRGEDIGWPSKRHGMTAGYRSRGKGSSCQCTAPISRLHPAGGLEGANLKQSSQAIRAEFPSREPSTINHRHTRLRRSSPMCLIHTEAQLRSEFAGT